MWRKFILILVLVFGIMTVFAQDTNDDSILSPTDAVHVLNRLVQPFNATFDLDFDGQITTDDARLAILAADKFIRFDRMSNYAVYYSFNQFDPNNSAAIINALSQYDLVIIIAYSCSADSAYYDAGDGLLGTLSPTQVAELRKTGTIVIAYISVGESASYECWYDELEATGAFIDFNPNFGTQVIDNRVVAARTILRTVAQEHLSYGYDGLFLDTVDNATGFETNTASGMIALIQELRTDNPNALIIQNRGFDVVGDTKTVINSMMFEGFTSTWQCSSVDSNNNCIYTFITQQNPFAPYLAASVDAQAAGVQIITLDFIAEGDTAGRTFALNQTAQYGFTPFITDNPDFDTLD